MTLFEQLDPLEPDPIFELNATYKKDPRKEKINLGIGVYQNEEGVPVVLNVVKKAERELLESGLDKNYLPLVGDGEYLQGGMELLFGDLLSPRMCAIQTVGGTGALRLGGELCKSLFCQTFSLSDPTWLNHPEIFNYLGFQLDWYPYYESGRLCFEKMCSHLNGLSPKTVVLFQGSCHNPTGLDPTLDEWKELSRICLKQQLLPYFDIAYQGLGSGIEEDVAGFRHFVREGHEMIVSYSFSKNLGLYGERVGFLAIVSADEKGANRGINRLKWIARRCHSAAPLQGARVAKTVLCNPSLKKEWFQELEEMKDRLKNVRSKVRELIPSWSFIEDQKGLFSYTGLTKDQVTWLRREKGIYLLNSGRMNVAGLNSQNIPYFIEAIRTKPQ